MLNQPAPQALVPGYFAAPQIGKLRNFQLARFFREPIRSRLRCSGRDAMTAQLWVSRPNLSQPVSQWQGLALLLTFQTGSAA